MGRLVLYRLGHPVGIRRTDASRCASPPSPGLPRLAARQLSWDFGRVTAGPVLTKGFQVANRGRRRLVLNEKTRSCECGRSRKATIIIPPGGSGEVTTEFLTKGLSGSFAIEVVYTTSDPKCPLLTFQLLADIENPEADASAIQPISQQ